MTSAKPNSPKWQLALKKLEKAIHRLQEVLQEPLDKNDYVLDATIQRFEFVVELYWKALKKLLDAYGVSVSLPRECFKEAYTAGWLKDEKIWLKMLHDRNFTSHTYEKENAMKVYQHIQAYFPIILESYQYLTTHVIKKLS